MCTTVKLSIIAILGLFSACFFIATARADWILEPEKSHLVYGSIKKNSIGENNHFETIEGRITEQGEVSLLIDLSSVETWVDIRNDRMKEFVFKTGQFPLATLRGQVDMDKFKNMPLGSQQNVDMSFEFNLHGHEQTLEAELVVLRLTEHKVVVLTQEIIFLDMEKFDLLPALKKLQELAELPSISTIVPVVFHLTFNHTP